MSFFFHDEIKSLQALLATNCEEGKLISSAVNALMGVSLDIENYCTF